MKTKCEKMFEAAIYIAIGFVGTFFAIGAVMLLARTLFNG